jgi:hypothetical protein
MTQSFLHCDVRLEYRTSQCPPTSLLLSDGLDKVQADILIHCRRMILFSEYEEHDVESFLLCAVDDQQGVLVALSTD